MNSIVVVAPRSELRRDADTRYRLGGRLATEQRAFERVQEHVADLVIDRAGNTLRTEMTQDDQKRIVVRFIEKL